MPTTSRRRSRRCAGGRRSRTTTWEVATISTPPDLAERLLALGLREDEARRSAAMVLEGELGPRRRGSRSRASRTSRRSRRTSRSRTRSSGCSTACRRSSSGSTARERRKLADRRFVRYIAWVEGKPAGAATATFAPGGAILHSGSVLPWARGRGAYRALVAFRQAEAAARGTPTVVTRAGAMSRPILLGLGFRELAEIRFLLDRPS